MESDIFLIESDRLIKYLKIWRKKNEIQKKVLNSSQNENRVLIIECSS